MKHVRPVAVEEAAVVTAAAVVAAATVAAAVVAAMAAAVVVDVAMVAADAKDNFSRKAVAPATAFLLSSPRDVFLISHGYDGAVLRTIDTHQTKELFILWRTIKNLIRINETSNFPLSRDRRRAQ
ncbi:MAG: hypothetical protein ABJB69_00330 [Spartobacteria bacterium]